MSASVLFDEPGPRTRARHHIYGLAAIVAIVAAIAWVIYRFYDTGQFDYAKWEPFITPKYVFALLRAWRDTLSVAALAVIFAVLLGFALGVGKLSDHGWLRWPCWLVVEFFRALPVIMLMVFTFYAVFGDLPIRSEAFWAAVLSLALYNGAVLAEVVRAGINAVPKGQAEAAYAVGMGKSQVMSIVLLPQAVKIMIPAIISQMVVAVKDTSLILIVLPLGLTSFAKQLPQEFNNLVPTVIVVTACYVITNLLLSWLATVIQRRFVGEKKLDITQVAAGKADAAAA